jgi:rRNA pseudouridine-1189 N-methylase Emg1 (Nep1/Mra1 family)
MADQLKGKRVPWSQLEEYLKLHKNTIVSFQDQLNSDMMDIPEIEAKLPKSFSQLYSLIGKILKDNNILPNQEESKVDQL